MEVLSWFALLMIDGITSSIQFVFFYVLIIDCIRYFSWNYYMGSYRGTLPFTFWWSWVTHLPRPSFMFHWYSLSLLPRRFRFWVGRLPRDISLSLLELLTLWFDVSDDYSSSSIWSITLIIDESFGPLTYGLLAFDSLI